MFSNNKTTFLKHFAVAAFIGAASGNASAESEPSPIQFFITIPKETRMTIEKEGFIIEMAVIAQGSCVKVMKPENIQGDFAFAQVKEKGQFREPMGNIPLSQLKPAPEGTTEAGCLARFR